MLVIGLICNLLIRPVADKWFMTDAELAEEKRIAHEKFTETNIESGTDTGKSTHPKIVLIAWTVVIVPLSWGIYKTLINVSKFFT
jgi:hypothetical protein